jgi:type I restriction enzyme S subunit
MQIKNEDFKKIPVLVPTREEQDRIVAFLDQKTAEIDALIAKKQRQIELLDEQKSILINRAVTRGLNPNAKLKPSGIEWIGDIPEHWITAPMYSRCDIRLGKMLDAAKIKGKHLQPYLRNTDVQWFEINSLDLPMMDFRPDEYERYSVKRGDLVVCEGGEPGRAALWDSDEPCFFQKALHRVRPVKGDDPGFLLYLFRNAVTMSAFSGVDKATIAHLTGEQLRRFRFAFPPVTEQARIAEYLADAQMRFSATTQRIESHIESLKTLRNTLIAHAVTGKIAIPAQNS